MRTEILKKVIDEARDIFDNESSYGISENIDGFLNFLAKYLGEKFEQDDLIQEKISSIELQKKAIARQLTDIEQEKAKLMEECAHLHGRSIISNLNGDAIEYICVTCGEEVCLRV